ncbi:hypothetical protein GGF31_006047 [Allomyces arbusculus]|nr:hypothetical protein GGF31_006047 [Allomyces arbusculus]
MGTIPLDLAGNIARYCDLVSCCRLAGASRTWREHLLVSTRVPSPPTSRIAPRGSLPSRRRATDQHKSAPALRHAVVDVTRLARLIDDEETRSLRSPSRPRNVALALLHHAAALTVTPPDLFQLSPDPTTTNTVEDAGDLSPDTYHVFFADHMPSITSLNLSRALRLTNAHVLAALDATGTNLTRLDLSRCPNITADLCSTLATRPWRSLQLSWTRIGSDGVDALVAAWTARPELIAHLDDVALAGLSLVPHTVRDVVVVLAREWHQRAVEPSRRMRVDVSHTMHLSGARHLVPAWVPREEVSLHGLDLNVAYCDGVEGKDVVVLERAGATVTCSPWLVVLPAAEPVDKVGARTQDQDVATTASIATEWGWTGLLSDVLAFAPAGPELTKPVDGGSSVDPAGLPVGVEVGDTAMPAVAEAAGGDVLSTSAASESRPRTPVGGVDLDGTPAAVVRSPCAERMTV